MARLARRTLLILLGTFVEGAVLLKKSTNTTVANATAAGKVEVLDAKDSVINNLAGTYRKYKGQEAVNESTNNTIEKAESEEDDIETAESEEDDTIEKAESEENAQVVTVRVRGNAGEEKSYYLAKGCKLVEEPRRGLTKEEDKPATTKKDSKMTTDECYYFCVETRSLFMSIKGGDTCTCFDRYEYLLSPDPGDGCDKSCPGDKALKCGGDKAENVYILESWVPKLPTKDCGKPDPVPHIEEMCENGGEEHGMTCNVKCKKGYRVAENSLMCDTAAGMWFGFVHCAPYLCMPPAPPIAFASKSCSGGAVDGVDHGQFGIDCPVSCLPGYDLKENTLKCEEPESAKEPRGVLKGEARCEPKSCGAPKKVDKANFPLADMSYPTRVQYTCQNGYTMDGSLTGLTFFHVACQADGKYEDISSKCNPLICGPPPQIENAVLEVEPPNSGDGVAFPAAVVYKCQTGFSMDGTGTGDRLVSVPCQATGAFPDPLPSCKPVVCGGPPGVAFSKLLESDAVKSGIAKLEIAPLGFEQTAILKCEKGYSFKPNEDPTTANMQFSVECEDDGLFENVQACLPVNCGKPPKAAKTLRPDMPVVFGQHVEYSCLDGYSLTGTTQGARSFKLDCMGNRRFSDLPPNEGGGCIPLECGRPSNVEHGKLVRGQAGEIVKFPSTLQYKCDEGFSTDRTKSSGASVFAVGCESTGAFSDMWECLPIDDCVGHTCGPQGECHDLHMDYQCKCDAGFEPIVNELTGEKECGNINDCGPEACGEGTCEDLVEGYRCHCPTGYEEKAPEEAPKNYTCSRVECGIPPTSQKADRPNVKGAYQDRIDYVCTVGYTLDGSPNGANMFHTTCQADKSFLPVPDCKPVRCGRPKRRAHAKVDKKGIITYKQKIRYTCNRGYSTDGSLIEDTKSYGAKCLETGAFTELMDCKPIICGSPKGLASSIVVADVLTFKQEATYTCLQGYSTDGSADASKFSFNARCQADGSFRRGAPGCQAIKCGPAPTISNAISELAEGDIVFPSLQGFSCLEGYSLDAKITGERVFTLKCEADGKFSGRKQCKNVECGPPPNSEHAQIIKGGDIDVGVFGSLFTYKCHKGYALEPLPTDMELIQPGGEKKFGVMCQANGQYSALATCKNIDDCVGHTCGPHGTCVDGISKFTCNCEAGFEEIEQNGEPYCGNVDDCGNHKCGEHGTCVDQVLGYTCACSMGYHIEKEGEDSLCKANSCGDMPAVENAEHDSDENVLKFPMIVTFECKDGYSIDKTTNTAAKTFQIQCDANGDTQNMQSCLPVTCPPPGGILNLKSGPDLTVLANYKDKLSYECVDGFTTTGEAGGSSKFELTCGSEGLFTPEVFPTCAPVKCGEPPAVGKCNSPEGIMFYPAEIPYECDLGYSMDGTPAFDKRGFSIKCKKDGKFDDLPSALGDKKCKKVKCGTFPDVGNAKFTKDKTGEFEDAMEYKCKSGFTVDGSAQGATSWSVTCLANGEFSESYECLPIVFTVLGRMKNAVNNRPVPGGKAVLTYKDSDGQVESPGNSIGEFNLAGVKQGKAIIKYSATGYINAELKLDVQNNIQSGTIADIAMSPKMPKDSWRAVLSWGKKPRDLDTHLYWKTRRSCHVYYARRRVDCPDGVKGILDVDDVSSFGPETLTFKNVGKEYNPKIASMGESKAPILQYRIKNYSRRPNFSTRDDVVVKLYNGERMVKEYKIGRDGQVDGRWWNVFELNAYTGQVIDVTR